MMIKELVATVSTRAGRKPTVCESCGAEFGCGAQLAGCWCSELKLSDETRAELRARFDGCLCLNCLERFASEEGQKQDRAR